MLTVLLLSPAWDPETVVELLPVTDAEILGRPSELCEAVVWEELPDNVPTPENAEVASELPPVTEAVWLVEIVTELLPPPAEEVVPAEVLESEVELDVPLLVDLETLALEDVALLSKLGALTVSSAESVDRELIGSTDDVSERLVLPVEERFVSLVVSDSDSDLEEPSAAELRVGTGDVVLPFELVGLVMPVELVEFRTELPDDARSGAVDVVAPVDVDPLAKLIEARSASARS